MNYLTHPHGKEVSAQLPLPTSNLHGVGNFISVEAEPITLDSAAADGSMGVIALRRRPILNLSGYKVGSYWGENRNKVYEVTNTGLIGTFTETAGSAAVIITDTTIDLEKMFETPAVPYRYILKAFDDDQNVLYGWIGGVTASSNNYTFNVFAGVRSSTQDWVGSLSSFDNALVRRIEIYSYESSFYFDTGTVLTEEISFDKETDPQSFIKTLTDGQYGIDYERAVLLYRKDTTGIRDTLNYKTSFGANLPNIVSYSKVVIAAGTPERLFPWIQATTLAFNDANPDTITDSGNNFIKKGFYPGMLITVSGATNAGNNSTFTVNTVAAGTLTLSSGAALTVEAAGATVTIQAEGSGIVVPDNKRVVIKAKAGNAGNMFVGQSSDGAKSSFGFPLDATDIIEYYVQNLNAFWLDTDNSGDGVNVTVEQA